MRPIDIRPEARPPLWPSIIRQSPEAFLRSRRRQQRAQLALALTLIIGGMAVIAVVVLG